MTCITWNTAAVVCLTCASRQALLHYGSFNDTMSAGQGAEHMKSLEQKKSHAESEQ